MTLPAPPGLCATCRHVRTITTRTSAFIYCRRSETDPRFPRYPVLPVRSCAGYEPEAPDTDAGHAPSGG